MYFALVDKGIVQYSLKSDLIIEMQTDRYSETPSEISSASVWSPLFILSGTVIKFHVVKEAKEAVLYFVQDF